MNEGAVSLSHLTGILTTEFEGGANHSITAETEDRKTKLCMRRCVNLVSSKMVNTDQRLHPSEQFHLSPSL